MSNRIDAPRSPVIPRDTAPADLKPLDTKPKPPAPADSAPKNQSLKDGFDTLPGLRELREKFGFTTAADSTGITAPKETAPTPLARNDKQKEPLPEVKDMQRQLNDWRAANGKPPLKEDGFYGPKTEKAVREFQKASGLPETGKASVATQARMGLEENPKFKGLNDAVKTQVRAQMNAAGEDFSQLDNVKTLSTTEGFDKLSNAHAQQMLTALSKSPGDASVAQGLAKLAGSEAFRNSSDATKTSLIDTLTQSPPMADNKIDGALRLVGSSEFSKLSDTDKALVAEGLKGAKADPKYADSVKSLLSSPKFQAMSAAEKTAVLSQVKHYPDARSVGNIEKLIKKDWYGKQDLADKQRSLKTVGYLSQYDGGDRAVVDNTLEKFVGEKSDYKMEWKTYPSGTGSTTFGEAADKTLWLNRGLIDGNNDKLVENHNTKHLVLHTAAHEVNHLRNGDKVAKTYQYFEAEYRAWYVGFKAENGRPPTNQEAMNQRISWQLNPTSFYGKYATEALKDPKEAAKFYDLLSKMSGQKVDASNFETVSKSDPSTWPTAGSNAPVPAGNIDNR
jgi:Putative peptidoglycan binding domain